MVNLRLAFRTLFRTPFLTLVAIVSLALGIGANSAIFSLYDQMLLRPLPVQEPGALVNLLAPGVKHGSQSTENAGGIDAVFSYPMFRDLERVQRGFTGIAAHRGFGANLAFRGQTQSGRGLLVSGTYFPVLGLTPALGRLLGPGDDGAPGAHPVAVLSHTYWQTRFAASPSVLNAPLIVNGQAMTIVGVAPAGFDSTTLGSRPEVFVPISMRGQMEPGWNAFENRRNYWIYLFARLKPGVTPERALADLNGPYKTIVNEVEAPLQEGMSEATLARFRSKTLTSEPGARGQSTLHGEARAPLTLLLGVTGFVLLIACANIANLLLARGAGRAAEMAVRLSLGASRWQIVSQLLLESCLLSLLGGAGGLLVSRWTLDAIAAMLPTDEAGMQFHLDATVIAFTGALAIGTGLIFGLFPALHGSRPDLLTALKGQTGQPSGARAAARFRTSLATAQIGLSMALLILAGLFTRSLVNVSRVELGLKVDHLVTFGLSPELNRYSPAQARAFFERVEDAIAAVPGVTAATASLVPILSGSNWGSSVTVQGFDSGPDTDTHSMFNVIGPGYFRTLGIPLLAGREFTRSDGLGGPKVVIVNEAFARKFRLGREAVGKRMNTGIGSGVKLEMEIIGLVQDAKYSEVKRPVPPLFFTPYRQDAEIGAINFYVRTALSPDQILATIPRVVSALDANLPVEDLRTVEEQVRRNVFIDRLITTLSAAFASLATLLAAIGLYGVLAYTVAQRTREIGLRMALGADGARVRAMILGQVARMTIVGGLFGIGTAVGAGHLGRSLLYELQGYDPLVLSASTLLLAAVALGAGYIPALRASRVEPMQALRYE